MDQIYLSRRNLMALLSKLDRKRDGQDTYCTLIKYDNDNLAGFNQSMESCRVTAVEDDIYYLDRPAGKVHPLDNV